MKLFSSVAWLALCAALASCGGKSESGGSGGASGAGGGTGATGATGGGGTGATGGTGGSTATCDMLESAYAAALAEAKTCNPVLSSLQCTQVVDTELPCPCTTYVNPANAAAVAKLASLRAEFDQKQCMEGIACPAIACIPPQSGGCEPNDPGTGGGHCVDFGPD